MHTLLLLYSILYIYIIYLYSFISVRFNKNKKSTNIYFKQYNKRYGRYLNRQWRLATIFKTGFRFLAIRAIKSAANRTKISTNRSSYSHIGMPIFSRFLLI